MDKLNIPKTIHVGYQKRNDTYTGQLAYVIYTDQKGKKRKETSWQSWRSDKIDPNDYDNEPLSGFVLNKGVGGTRGSWSSRNVRNEYIRIYDPRGFEFEISVANLLFILTECNAVKGKGLDGEFVYAWGGTELILLPVCSADYKASSEFTDLQVMKVTKKDMKEGRTYQHKDVKTLVYIGRHKIRDLHDYYYSRQQFNRLLTDPDTFRHVFYDVESKDWHFERGFTKLAKIVSEESHDDFANLHTQFLKSKYVSKAARIVLSPITVEQVAGDNYRSGWFYIKVENGYQLVAFDAHGYRVTYGYGYGGRERLGKMPNRDGMTEDNFWPLHPDVVAEVNKDNICHDYVGYNSDNYVSRSFIEGKELFTAEIQLQSKKKLEVSNYVKRR